MNYFKINYDKLRNLEEKNLYIIGVIFIFVIFYLIMISCFIKIEKKEEYIGIVEKGLLKVGVKSSFSDILKNNDTLEFNKTKMHYKIIKFGEYEIIDDNIYEIVYIKVDVLLYDNEVGKVTFYYNEENLCKYIFELF